MVLIYRTDKPDFARQFAEKIRAAIKAEAENHSGLSDNISVHSVLRKPLAPAQKQDWNNNGNDPLVEKPI